MDNPGVVIVVPASDQADGELESMVAACTSILAEGICSRDPGETRGAVAIVSFQDVAGLSVRVEVRLRRERGPTLSTETSASFSERDPAIERWRSLGLLIGTAVNQLSADAVLSPPEEVTKAVEPPPRSAGHPKEVARAVARPEVVSREHPFRLRAGAVFGLDPEDGAPSGGAAIDFGWFVLGPLLLRTGVSFARTPSADSVVVDRVVWTLGVGAELFQSDAGFYGHALFDIGPELVIASDQRSVGQRVTGVFRPGLEIGWTHRLFNLGVTTSVQREWSATRVQVDGADAIRTGPYNVQWAGMLGFQF